MAMKKTLLAFVGVTIVAATIGLPVVRAFADPRG
jgi:hypothetical protein